MVRLKKSELVRLVIFAIRQHMVFYEKMKMGSITQLMFTRFESEKLLHISAKDILGPHV
jgi:hypothetical protein